VQPGRFAPGRAGPGRAAIKRPSRQIVITRRASESLSTAATAAAAAASGVTREPEAEEGAAAPDAEGEEVRNSLADNIS